MGIFQDKLSREVAGGVAGLDQNSELIKLPKGAATEVVAGRLAAFFAPDGTWKNFAETVVNSNGTAIKFADGTMIVNHELITDAAADITWIFPVAFVSVPFTNVSALSAALSLRFVTIRNTVTPTSCSIAGYNSTARSQIRVILTAIGRWKA